MPQVKPMTYRQQMLGFPYWQMAVVSLIRFSEPISFTSLFPYVFYMVRDFKIAPTEQMIPKYTAYLASCFALCQFLFAVKWGKLLDRIGRKRVLLYGLFGTSFSMLLFGFSQNFYMALFARCLAGTLNGNISVLRTVIGEIATERRHQPLAFSLLPLLFNFGAVIGPSIGGSKYLTRPSSHNPYTNSTESTAELTSSFVTGYEKFITRFPYALSNIVVCCFLWFSLLCGFLFLEETQEDMKYKRDYGVELGDLFLTKVLGIKTPTRPWQKRDGETLPLLNPDNASIHSQIFDDEEEAEADGEVAGDEEETVGYSGESSDVDSSSLSENSSNIVRPLTRSLSDAIVRTYSQHEEDDLDDETNPPINPLSDKDRYANAFTPQVISVISANFIISFHNVVYNEFLPVFLATRFQREKLQFPFRVGGGFGYDSSAIGTLFSSTGIMGIIIVLIVFPMLDRRLGTIAGYRLSVAIFPGVYFLVPLAIFTLHGYNSKFPTWVTPIFLYCLTSLKTLASATGMPQVMILQHRAASKRHRAYINSSTMSFLSLARFVGPIVFGWLMSFGDAHGIASLSWWVLSLLALCGTLQSWTMRDYEEIA